MNEPLTILYIAGPISGMAEENRPAFEKAAKHFRDLGFIVRNPHEFCHDIPVGSNWSIYMRRCLQVLAECTDIILLPGWKHSKGANIELQIAEGIGMNIHYSLMDFENFILEIRERMVG